MFLRLLLLFTIVPAVELYLLVTIGSQIGVGITLGIAIFTGILGAALAKREGLRTLQDARMNAQSGKMPTDQMIDGLLLLVAAAVLITPGFLTDAAGFTLLLPPMRTFIRNSIKKSMGSQFKVYMNGQPGNFNAGNSYSPPNAPQNPFQQPNPFNNQPPRDNKPGTRKPDIVIDPTDDKN